MKILRKMIFFFLTVAGVAQAAVFGDLAVFAAKAYFGGYVAQNASMEQCVVFLNKRGVCFSLLDLMNSSKDVTQEDFARATGQSKLLFLGCAELENGCIKKPLEAESWVDYCLLNDIDLAPPWNRFTQRTAEASMPEVRNFFKK